METAIDKLIRKRRATPPGMMLPDEIPDETIRQLLESANWAPTHKNTEPWRFKVFTGAAKEKFADEVYSILLKKIEEGETVNPQKAEKFSNNLKKAPVVIAIIFERDAARRIPEWEEIAAVAMAVQNMWLSATEKELGAFWSTPEFLEHFTELVKLTTGQKLLGFFMVGKTAIEYPSKGRGDIAQKTEWIK